MESPPEEVTPECVFGAGSPGDDVVIVGDDDDDIDDDVVLYDMMEKKKENATVVDEVVVVKEAKMVDDDMVNVNVCKVVNIDNNNVSDEKLSQDNYAGGLDPNWVGSRPPNRRSRKWWYRPRPRELA